MKVIPSLLHNKQGLLIHQALSILEVFLLPDFLSMGILKDRGASWIGVLPTPPLSRRNFDIAGY